EKSRRHMEIVILWIKLRLHLQRFLAIVEVRHGRRAETFECGAIGISRLARWIFPKVTHFEFAGAESRELIIGEHTEIVERDWTGTDRDDRAHGIGMCARISETKNHSPRISDDDKFFGVQLRAKGFDVFDVGVQIDGRQIVLWQLRST